jgi:carbon-monoxide dehydrogenase large subunit/6-hydroxypseudooxynicotine dehydrogenase subunit gamma
VIGRPIRRLEDRRLLTGHGRYVADVERPGMVTAVVVRSPHSHARIREIDLGRARAHPGVLDGITAADLPGAGDARIPVRLGATPALAPFLQPLLAAERVRYVGEPVAVLVARDAYAARDAAELVDVDYEVLPAVLDARRATDAGVTAIHAAGNVAAAWVAAFGDVERAVREARHVLRRTFRTNRHTGMPIETRGLVAEYDGAGGHLTVWGPTKVPYFNRRALAGFLALPEEAIRFLEGDVGGGFGVRGELYPEDFLIPLLAMRLGRPVRWIEDRREHLMTINHSREQHWELTIAADGDGRLLALDAVLVNDMGAYVKAHGTLVARLSAAYLPGAYVVPHYRCRVTCAMTNTTPTGTMRAPGHYEVDFVREQALDLLAAKLGLDRAELRRRNLVPAEQMPYQVGTEVAGAPVVLDTGDYPLLLDRALRAARYDEVLAECAAENARDADVRMGVGLACIVEPSGVGPRETAKVQVTPDGTLVVDTGVTSQGQGQETTLAQICAAVLDCPADGVVVRHGDTALLPTGEGTYASRAAIMGGSAVHGAALALKDEILKRAAARLEASPHDLVLDDGRVFVAGVPSRAVSLAELAGAAPPLEALHVHESTVKTMSFSVQVAVVAVDRATGRVVPRRHVLVADVGRAINPLIVEGQLAGGLVQGLSGALGEELVYDDAGQLLTATLMDYALVAAGDCPRLELHVLEEWRAPSNPLGIKGVGEAGTAGAAAALASAVGHALGAEITRLPVSASRVHAVTTESSPRA